MEKYNSVQAHEFFFRPEIEKAILRGKYQLLASPEIKDSCYLCGGEMLAGIEMMKWSLITYTLPSALALVKSEASDPLPRKARYNPTLLPQAKWMQPALITVF